MKRIIRKQSRVRKIIRKRSARSIRRSLRRRNTRRNTRRQSIRRKNKKTLAEIDIIIKSPVKSIKMIARKPKGYTKEMEVMLAKKFSEVSVDPVGWYMSEKIDGIRAYWDHKEQEFFTRNGNLIHVPDFFIELMKQSPKDIDLDGEMWIDRESFNKINGLTRRHNPVDSEWSLVKYIVFDVPIPKVPYIERYKMYKDIVKKINSKHVVALETTEIKSIDEMTSFIESVEKINGEGIMIRNPESMYERKRSKSLLKIKKFEDSEGTLVGYNDGRTGKYKGLVGSLILKLKNGTLINVGSGLDDATRNNPPPIGSVITYKYFEQDSKGVPRHPIYVCVRHDI
jgi:DNA ligase-1